MTFFYIYKVRKALVPSKFRKIIDADSNQKINYNYNSV